MNQRGSTTAEYVGIVIVVVLVFLALVAVGSTSLGRRAPVRPLPAILHLGSPEVVLQGPDVKAILENTKVLAGSTQHPSHA